MTGTAEAVKTTPVYLTDKEIRFIEQALWGDRNRRLVKYTEDIERGCDEGFLLKSQENIGVVNKLLSEFEIMTDHWLPVKGIESVLRGEE